MRVLIIFFAIVSSQKIGFEYFYNFIVWDVGQGSWSTYLTEDTCYHFDMGGEKFPWHEIFKHCRKKKNFTLLTHEDWDHMNGIFHFTKSVFNNCLHYPKQRKRNYPKGLGNCPPLPSFIRLISMGSTYSDQNSGSIIYLLRNQILITGDSPMSEEKKWYKKLPRGLILLLLGHHGSHTSTSTQLLNWIRPKMSVASARRKKYGHPHRKVLGKLKKQRVPALRTETLGNLFFEIP